MYDNHRRELLEDATFRGASRYGRAVYGTWDLSFVALEKRASQSQTPENAKVARQSILLVQIFALLHHENIAGEIFRRSAESPDGPALGGKDRQGLCQTAPYSSLLNLLQLDQEKQRNQLPFKEGV